MPGALTNAAAQGARNTATNPYFANEFMLFRRGTWPKQYRRPIAAVRTSIVSAGMNQAIEATGTPKCRSTSTKPAKDTSMSAGQILLRTSINMATRIAQPGQSGHAVCGFRIRVAWSRGARYDRVATRHTRTIVARRVFKFVLV